ncbi:cytochrome P450 4c3 isoform X2 [Cherax quadricarinatus]|uniref:cytochrome P450 4c3 isoform X2 n=1 Tax=Cherax quadricarinatus TaxID=27406 RepID=UPI00387EC82E
MLWLGSDTLEWAKADLLIILAITALVIYSLVLFFKMRQKVWLLDQLPGPRGLPILGNLLFLNVDTSELFQRLMKVAGMGEVARMWMLHMPYCFLSSARTMEVILSSQKHIDKSWDYELLHPWLGLSLLTSTGSHWQTRRKLLTPAFHFKILEQFVDVFNKQSNKLVNKLQKNADGIPFDIFDDIAVCVLDALCETAMGRSINAQDDWNSEYVQAVKKFTWFLQYQEFRPWLRNDFIFKLLGYAKEYDACLKILHNLSTSTIREKKKYLKNNTNKTAVHQEEDALGKKKRLAFLDLLLEYAEDNPEFTEEEIRKEVDTFMFAGHDTTASAVNWTLYNLGLHPDIQDPVPS